MKLFFDTETTGKYRFDYAPGEPCQPHIVQLAAVLHDDNRRERACFNLLIQPTGWVIPVEAQAIHGISTDMCAASGITLSLALRMFECLFDRAYILVAHNVQLDRACIHTAIERNGGLIDTFLAKPTFCTMRESTEIVGLPSPYGRGCKWPKLIEAYRFFFQRDFDGAHDAMADVRACAAVYWALQDRHAGVMDRMTKGMGP